MDLATISMDKNKARQAFLDYRHAVRDRHDAEDAEIMRGYRALARGQQLINLRETIVKGGVVDRTLKTRNGQKTFRLPALAIMRADQKHCYVKVEESGSVLFYNQEIGYASPRANERRNVVRLGRNTLPMEGFAGMTTDWHDMQAMVPTVPPALRPADKLGNYHILWEAEWSLRIPPAPKDPALLKHIGGDLYAVCAIWDLTDLERAVLAGRNRG